MPIMGGFYENDIFCEIGEFGKGFITCKGLAKKLDGTTKEAYWQLAIFAKMANLRKGGIVQESVTVKPGQAFPSLIN